MSQKNSQRLALIAGRAGVAPVRTFPARPVRLPVTRRELYQHRAHGDETVSAPPDGAPAEACQQPVDRKAFKGRGAKRRMINAKAAVDKVHTDMRRLAEATKSIKNRRFYLAVHVRGSTGQISLRWRRAGMVDTSHIAWDQLAGFMENLPPELVKWYETVNDMASVLNSQEKHNRSVLRHALEMLRIAGPV